VCEVTSGSHQIGTWSGVDADWSPTTTDDAMGAATVTPPLEAAYSTVLPNGEEVGELEISFSYQFSESEEKHYCLIVLCGPVCEEDEEKCESCAEGR
jgi:hypothetical protein